MGCRHSSSPPESPVKLVQNGGPIILKSKISIHRAQVIDQRISNGTKSSRLSISSKKISRLVLPSISVSLEQILDGHGKHLIKRFELDTACLLLDASRAHTLLLDGRQLRLIHMETMSMETNILPVDCRDIQEIAWSSKLGKFLLLTTDQLYQTGCKKLQPVPIHEIQFIAEGPRKSYMAVDGDDLLVNRSFGYDIRRYSLSNFSLVQSPRAYLENENICVTTIRLNSNKILALSVSIGEQQMIDLVNLNNDRLLHRINCNTGENILYPIDLHNNGQWFAKICMPCVNIGHCLVSPDGQITRLKLFPNQDNFIRCLCTSPDNRWLITGRQHALELYQLCTS
ncbi:unnamed protein product [Rotaria socialis]|uniref:Uncharacterized protein n=1 Tax=Rotaria socialis TaxID=392032 RepID=A0A819WS94_9BILA|nr:unnamed protein product [Rotaria socialis]CAF3476221.1 unnamed protein product [Rotaria socialis]CAF3492537.1 unnamed protein product [Rotaria socialis]CAF4103770.1 unnamed protein product [Rotaria socialis]CAF4130802.1 unnamed protein product [Rotaria socialis]